MPYRRVGKSIYKIGGGKVGSSSSIPEAKEYLQTLRAIEHGFKPTGKKAKSIRKIY